MSIDIDDLLLVIGSAQGDCAKLGVQLDAEIICGRYNEYRDRHGQNYSYDIREMQKMLANLIRPTDKSSVPKLNGSIHYVDGNIFKVIVFGLR